MPYDPSENDRKMTKVPEAEQRRRRSRRRLFLRGGQAMLLAGGIVAATHWLAHVGAFGSQPSGMVDLAVGYPMAAVLLVGGAVAVGQK